MYVEYLRDTPNPRQGISPAPLFRKSTPESPRVGGGSTYIVKEQGDTQTPGQGIPLSTPLLATRNSLLSELLGAFYEEGWGGVEGVVGFGFDVGDYYEAQPEGADQVGAAYVGGPVVA